MGMNYYFHYNVCGHCGRSDKIHIGKSSYGWTFSFRGYKFHDKVPDIKSYKDWLNFIEPNLKLSKDCQIENEEGEIVSLEYFKKMIIDKSTESNNHTLNARQWHQEHASRDCWLDDEGHSFCRSEFS